MPIRAHCPIDQSGLHGTGQLSRESDRTLGPVARAADFSQRTWTCPGLIDPDHDIWVEHGNQPFNVPTAQGGKESIDNPSLLSAIGVGMRSAPLHTAMRATG